jgi:orotidine-5'-phosphate decarboxylase
MTRKELITAIQQKKSYLCVGLDPDLTKIPALLRSQPDPLFAFNRQIIDATRESCVAYKINTAFYESLGIRGWETLMRTAEYIPDSHLKIADAKRGDIGNSSAHYARAFFETMQFDAVTVAPYMGEDSVRPFLEHAGKWTILLGLTSNAGAIDFELQPAGDGLLFEQVLKTSSKWGSPENLMFVIGATRPEWIDRVRQIVPSHFLLVPGIGAQGGNLSETSHRAFNGDIGLLINSSRAILYASGGSDFAAAAGKAAAALQREMATYLASR